MQFLKQELITIRVAHDGVNVQLVISGRLAFNIPWQQALDVSKALHKHAKLAEELANAERIIHEEAALLRSGAPFSLTNHPDMKAEAGKEAAWGWVRRYLPNRIRQRGTVYAPTVIRKPPQET